MVSSAQHTKTEAPEAQPLAKTIFVIEDDEILGELIVQILQDGTPGRMGYHVVHAVDSLEALQKAATFQPDLFLMDYYLPRMDGLELYDRLHQMPGLENVPAIFLSSNPPLKEIEKRHLLSVRKPFNLRELLHTIDQLLD